MADKQQEERSIHDLLRSLDHHAREISADDVMRRARRPRLATVRIAAGLAATIGLAGVAYALPGSPVRGWVRSVLDSADRPTARSARDTAAPVSGGESGAGMLFDPAEPLIVRITAVSGAHLRVELTDGAEIVARMLAGEGRFTSEPNELGVRLLATDTLELFVPRSAASVDVVSGDRRLFVKRGALLRADTEAETGGRYRIDLGGGVP